MSNTLGTYDELPQRYRNDLTKHNLFPLWPSLRAVLPPGIPTRQTQSTAWDYANIRPLLMKAGELTPIEKAERRVLVLANPGCGLTEMKASSVIYLGMQLILPGEVAPNHRHTPNAARIVVEGEGAFTTVDGEKCLMKRGDLILTPAGTWHEHHHEGDEPVVWLDVLDLPLIYGLEGSWSEEADDIQPLARKQDRSYDEYSAAGIVPEPDFQRISKTDRPVPQIRFPWAKTKKVLEAMAAAGSERVQIAYVNPETGKDVFPSIGFSALMLRPGETVDYPRRSCATIFHMINGKARINIEEGAQFEMAGKDTCCAPGYNTINVKNLSLTQSAFFIMADESPLHEYLGIY